MKAETFQDPAAQMKRALFQSLLIGAVAVVLYLFCVEPWQSDLQKARKEYLVQQDQRNKMINNLKGAGHVEEQLNVISNNCQPYMRGLLEKSVGSYGTAAESQLKPLAEKKGVVIRVDPTDLLMRRLPLPTPPSPQLYARKPIRLTCTGPYPNIAEFVHEVEREMPLVALEAFTLKVQKDPENQLAIIVFEWPIKGENTANVVNGGAKK